VCDCCDARKILTSASRYHESADRSITRSVIEEALVDRRSFYYFVPWHHLSKVRADAGVAGPMSAKRLVETVTRRRDITEQPAERYELRRRRPFNLPMSARVHRHRDG
jgi:hypothetical protein